MHKSLRHIFKFKPLARLISLTTPLFYPNMVRYFKNSFEDYKTGTAVKLDKNETINQINEHVAIITKRLQPSRKNVDGGLYVGITGVAYMFYHLSKNPVLSDSKASFITRSLEYCKPALVVSAGERTSFLLGDAGTYALAAVLNKESGVDPIENTNKYKSLYRLYLSPNFLKCGGDEFFVGRAGYLAGALWLSKELQIEVLTPQEMYKLCDLIVASGKDYALKNNSPCPLMYHYYNTEYLGAAHGISFILQVLLCVPNYLKTNLENAKAIKETVDFILSLQSEDGNWPCCMEEVSLDDHKLVHWCHGAPGTVYLMARAFLVYKDEKYRNACIKAADLVWEKGLLRKGPGICHGVAGNGYVFLLLYRLTKDEKYLHRAKVFADFISTDEFQRDARLPDNPQSLFEGTAGTVCYLADMLVPDVSEFPFHNIF